MKKTFLYLLVIALIGITPVCFGQLRPVPAVVTNALAAKFPAAKNVEWRDKIKEFHAFFMDGISNYEVKFNPDGTWISTEKSIESDTLPATIKEGLRLSKYADWEIRSTFMVFFHDEVTRYRVVVSKNDFGKRILVFNPQGQLLRDNLSL
jgi:hypothetical protein